MKCCGETWAETHTSIDTFEIRQDRLVCGMGGYSAGLYSNVSCVLEPHEAASPRPPSFLRQKIGTSLSLSISHFPPLFSQVRAPPSVSLARCACHTYIGLAYIPGLFSSFARKLKIDQKLWCFNINGQIK